MSAKMKYRCPFCHKEVTATDKSMQCLPCGFYVSLADKYATVTDSAPQYIKDSFSVVSLYMDNQSKILLLMASHLLFTPAFNKDEVYAIANGQTPFKTLNPVAADSCCIIAGGGFISTNLYKMFAVPYLNNWDESGADVSTMNINQWLFMSFIAGSCTTEMGPQPTLEQMLPYTAAHLSGLDKTIDHPSDESVLYSLIFMRPHMNIQWNPSNMIESIESYILALTEVIPKSLEQMPFNIREHCDIFTDKDGSHFNDEFYRQYLMSNMSTFVNGGKSAYDILDNKYLDIAVDAKKLHAAHAYAHVSELYRCLEKIHRRYTKGADQSFGVNWKYYWGVCKSNDPNEIVFNFWNYVHDLLAQSAKRREGCKE